MDAEAIIECLEGILGPAPDKSGFYSQLYAWEESPSQFASPALVGPQLPVLAPIRMACLAHPMSFATIAIVIASCRKKSSRPRD